MRRILTILAVLAGFLLGTSSALASVPSNTAKPAVSGTATVGSTLTTTRGTWTNNPTSYTIRWQDCNSDASTCATIPGATRINYTVQTSDEGYYLRAGVEAKNAQGSSTTSNSPVTEQVPTPTGVPCALTHAAGAGVGSCWDENTGVQAGTGFSEAQILAGSSDLTYVNGDVTASTQGETISNEWINGCISVKAKDVTIENVLIHSTDKCEGGDNQSQESAINGGFDGTEGLLVKYVTVDDEDPGNLPLSTGADYGISLGFGSTCDYCDSFGFGADYAAVGEESAPTTIEHSYAPNVADDWYTSGCGGEGPHLNDFYVDSVEYVTLENVWADAESGGCGDTGAISFLGTYGPPDHDTIDDSYAEGGYGTDITLGSDDGNCGTPGMVVTNDALSDDNGYGGSEYWAAWSTAGNTWTGNTIPETGQALAEPGNDC